MILLVALSILIYNSMVFINLDRYAKIFVFAMLIIIGGYSLGQRWWDYIYIQKKHTNKLINKLINKK